MILMATSAWVWIVVLVGVGCLVGGYFLARYVFKNELKKNPPINEKMIRAMYRSMGRTPTEAQIRATIKAMRDAQ